jgi:3-hydroxyacyl-[acyl-carrier-protein] dehydratase
MIVTREFVMPDSHPVLPGHFPGDPIVPGVFLMAWCEQLAAELIHAPLTARTWLQFKFLHPLKPGQSCSITMERGSDTRTVFRITAGPELIASGIFEWTCSNP